MRCVTKDGIHRDQANVKCRACIHSHCLVCGLCVRCYSYGTECFSARIYLYRNVGRPQKEKVPVAYDHRDHQNLPGFVLMIAPYMEELVRLRKENDDLRFKKLPEIPGLKELLKGTELKLYQGDDGKWAFSFPYQTVSSGGRMSGTDTMLEAFKAAIQHMVYLLKKENEPEYEDH